MHTTSFLITGGATTLGAIALYLVFHFGMNASDEYASELAVTSEEYLKLRAKAVTLGKDPSKIKDNSARSKRPADYQEALAGGLTSPYIRPDSDTGESSSSGRSRDSDQKAAEKAGLTQQELEKLVDQAAKGSSNSSGNGSNFSVDSSLTASEEVAILPKGEYTVDDEIRYQLATEKMSDEKRSILESLLPKEEPKAIRAVNVILEFDTKNCVVPKNSNSFIGVMFRNKSEAIRGSSLNELDELISMRERCDGRLLVEDHAEAVSESDIKLRQSRREKVKYYLLQRQVPKESIVISSL